MSALAIDYAYRYPFASEFTGSAARSRLRLATFGPRPAAETDGPVAAGSGPGGQGAGRQGLATDVAIAAINDGRLDGAKLAAGLTQLIATGLIKAARWAKALENVSRASPLHAEVVREAIVQSLCGDPAAMPKDLHALVEVLKELVVESQSAVEGPAREFLEQLSGSGKLAKSAKSILAVKPVGNVERIQSIQRRAVEIGLDRAERWSRHSH